ncbi:DUF2637 domain-containing protein [Streptomyces sp. NPDC046876]|uniref:DUF2637 domain-containing protein n=1 Tax=Streptomyces sp. NPDC046876 TaxID=3155616 RepID=UPI0033CF3323
MRDFHSGEPFTSPEEFYAATSAEAWRPTGHYDTLPGDPDRPGPGRPGGIPQMSPTPEEELGFLLQETMAAEYNSPPLRQQPSPYGLHPDGPTAGDPFAREDLDTIAPIGLTGRHLPPRRRRRTRRWVIDWLQTTSFSIATLAAALVTLVSLFGGIIAYEPLHRIAELRTPAYVADWWPLLVYGPWAVASLSILRAALHQRRALHSWLVVLTFSGTAVLLCLAQAPRTLTDEAAAALPQMASLACFHQLVRLITLTKPPRKNSPRHRTALPRIQPSAPPSAPQANRPTIPRSRRPF